MNIYVQLFMFSSQIFTHVGESCAVLSGRILANHDLNPTQKATVSENYRSIGKTTLQGPPINGSHVLE